MPGRLLKEGKVGRRRQTHMDTRHAYGTYDNMRGDTPLSHGAGGLISYLNPKTKFDLISLYILYVRCYCLGIPISAFVFRFSGFFRLTLSLRACSFVRSYDIC